MIESCGIQLGLEVQAGAEAESLDLQVEFEEADFVAEGDDGAGGLGQGEAKEFAERDEHFLGGARILAQEGGDGVEGVEEEVGLQLGLQGVEPRLGEMGFQGQRATFALAVSTVERDGVRDSRQRSERQQVEQEGGGGRGAEDIGECRSAGTSAG